MKNIVFFLIIVFFSLESAFAGWAGNLKVNRVYTGSSGHTNFGTTTMPSGTCSNWGEFFAFDSKTEGGKNMLSIILAAKVSGQSIDVWFTDSTTPGKDQNSGCALSTLNAVGLSAKQ